MNFFTSSFNPRTYSLTVLVLLAALGSFVIFIRAFFFHTGDLLPEKEAVEKQLASREFCLYSTIAADNNNAYKWALYAKHKPQIITLGSSRSLLFHHKMFSVPFLNMGRTFNYLHEGGYAVDKIVEAKHKPSTVILIVDFWHFHEKSKPFFGNPRQPYSVNYQNANAIRRLAKAFLQNKQMYKFVPNIYKKTTCHLGVSAKLKRNGFGPKGFRYYGNLAKEEVGSFYDFQFKNTLHRVRKGVTGFPHGEEPVRQRLDYYIRQINKLEKAGVKVIAVAPYIPPLVYSAMIKSEGFGYVKKAFSYLENNLKHFHNFHHLSNLTNNNCEFLDGFHQGDIVNARILKALSKSDKQLTQQLNMNEIIKITQIQNRALYYSSKYLKVDENDFLGLGCKKAQLESSKNVF